MYGLTGLGGECDSLNQVDVEKCVECIAANRDMAVGVKIRLSADVQNDGANEQEAYRFVNDACKLNLINNNIANYIGKTISIDKFAYKITLNMYII